MATLIDTNVLIDVLDVGSDWEDWSVGQLAAAREQGAIVINPIIFAEMAAGFDVEGDLNTALPPVLFTREELPWRAAFLAGRAFRAYKRSAGVKLSPLPDFYIGAHASVRGYRLLTRDASRYRSYFPSLDIISPDTHP
jgi:predicted nucleic acid-binding protein